MYNYVPKGVVFLLKKVFLGLLSAVMVLTLCGCDLFTADMAELLSPPALSGDLRQIAEAISKTVGGKYEFEYPQTGEYHSALVQKDVNGDGKKEAIAFYSTYNDDIETVNINVVRKKGDEWKSYGEQSIVGSGVHRVDFCDLDRDGINEILVGWQIYGTSEMQLAVYSFKDNVLSQRMLKRYNHFVTCNLNGNKTDEILVIESDAKKSHNTASLYELTDDGFLQIGRCELDSKVENVGHPIVEELSSGKNAVYIDSVKGIGAITEVLLYEKGKLVNPLYDEQTKETTLTLRSASFKTVDFNNDGILEIPVQLNVPSVSKSEVAEKLYLTSWCTFNGEILTPQVTSMINVLDRYYYNLPAKWIGKIAILKDTDNRIREIYSYDTEKMEVGGSLIYFRTVSKKDWQSGIYNALDMTKIVETENDVIACRISNTAKEMGITIEKVIKDFEIYTQE
jgi:hypothetical protein